MVALGALWRRLFPRPIHLLVALLVCIVIPAALVGKQITEHVAVSPIDELNHWDYVVRLGEGHLPRLGEALPPERFHEERCRAAAAADLPQPDECAPGAPADVGSPGGEQYEAQQPPGYYALVLPVRWVGMAVFGLDDLTASRAAGAVLLVMGLCILWVAGRLLRISPWVLASGILLVGSAPAVIYMSSYVTNDASGVLAGALVILAGTVAWRRPGLASTAFAVLVGVAAAALKQSNLLAIAAVSLTFAILAWYATGDGGDRRVARAVRRWAKGGGALVVGAVLAALAWMVVMRTRQLVDPHDLVLFGFMRMDGVDAPHVLRAGVELFDPFNASTFSPDTLGTDAQKPLQVLTAVAVGAGALSGLFVAERRWNHWLGLACVATILVGAPVLALGVYVTYGVDPLLPGRYGISLTPLLVLALVAGLRGTVARGALGALAAASAATTFLILYA